MKNEALQVMEKDISSVSHAELLKIVINQKKAELDDTHHKILLAKNNLRQTEQNCLKTQTDFNQKLAQEKQDLERLRNQKLNEFSQRQERIEQSERRHNERETRLLEKEDTQTKLSEERKALYQERVELEKIKRNSQAGLERLRTQQSEAENKINQAAQKEAKAIKDLTTAQQFNSSAEQQLNQAKEKEKKVAGDLENLQKIREEVTPKIAELDVLTKKNEKILAEAKEKEDNANAKIEEDSKMMADIKKQYENLKVKELEIASREEEILRQEITIKNVKSVKKG